MYDVIVAGAGPAGLTVAGKLSKRGIRTLLIEKDRIGKTEKAWGGFLSQLKEESLDDTILNLTTHLKYTHYLGAEIVVNGDFVTIDSKKLLLKLKKRINKKKCTLIENCELISFNRDKKNKTIALNTNKGQYTSRLLVDTTGYKSMIAKSYGLNKKIKYLQCMGYEFHGQEINEKEAILSEIAFPTPHKTWFWVEPLSKTSAWIGTMNIVEKPLPKEVIEEELNKFIRLKDIKDRRKNRKYGLIPIGETYRSYFDNILLVGDSAAQALPHGFFGLIPAIRNAKIAAKVAEESINQKRTDERFLKRYQKRWVKKIKTNYAILSIVNKLNTLMNDIELNEYLKTVSGFKSDIHLKGIKLELTKNQIRSLFLQIIIKRPLLIFRLLSKAKTRDKIKIIIKSIGALI